MPYMCRAIFAKRPNPVLVLMVASQMGNPAQHTLPKRLGHNTLPYHGMSIQNMPYFVTKSKNRWLAPLKLSEKSIHTD